VVQKQDFYVQTYRSIFTESKNNSVKMKNTYKCDILWTTV